jgi:hypothetical protein
MDAVIFSKDRAFQLYSLLETIDGYVEGIDNIFVQFSYSNEEYLEGYQIISNHFPNVSFVDETVYGFNNTLYTLLKHEVKSSNVFLEVDDVIYFDSIDLNELEAKFKLYNTSKLAVSFDPSIFDPNFFTVENDVVVVDKTTNITNQIQEMVLKYPFNVSGAIHKVADIISLFIQHRVSNPIDLEIKGSTFSTFTDYPYVVFNTKEVCKQIHTNNTLKRYEEVFSNAMLNSLILKGEVIDLVPENIKNYPSDMRWFNGEDIGRFPIFPWEVSPIYHSEIINKRKRISL